MWSFKSARWGLAVLTVFAGISLSGCGYHLQGRGGSSLPPHIKRIHIPIFVNNTFEQGIEVRVTDSIRNLIIGDGRVTLSNGISDADAVMEGQVLQFRLRPIAFSSDDRAQEFRLRMTLKVSLRDLESNRILFSQTVVSDREYRVTTDLGSNEQAQTNASQQASDSIAKELQGLMIEGF